MSLIISGRIKQTTNSCHLDQTHLEYESSLLDIMQFRFRNRVTTKKRSSPKIEEFLSPKSSEDQQKNASIHFVVHSSAKIVSKVLKTWYFS